MSRLRDPRLYVVVAVVLAAFAALVTHRIVERNAQHRSDVVVSLETRLPTDELDAARDELEALIPEPVIETAIRDAAAADLQIERRDNRSYLTIVGVAETPDAASSVAEALGNEIVERALLREQLPIDEAALDLDAAVEAATAELLRAEDEVSAAISREAAATRAAQVETDPDLAAELDDRLLEIQRNVSEAAVRRDDLADIVYALRNDRLRHDVDNSFVRPVFAAGPFEPLRTVDSTRAVVIAFATTLLAVLAMTFIAGSPEVEPRTIPLKGER